MNEKYIQALILGSIIGFAIVIDDYIGPKPNHRMMQKHIMIKDSKNSNWREKSGKKINLHELEGHDVLEFKSDDDDKKIIIKINSDDLSGLNVQSIVSEVTDAVKTFGEENLTDEEIDEIKTELQDAKNEVSELLENININIEVEVENVEL
jgi:predicted HNH restriction endonuclease|tara:strand:+ start:908 stop:1360 length:453 start_codon:yes stop_codon:yes gene_type:complete